MDASTANSCENAGFHERVFVKISSSFLGIIYLMAAAALILRLVFNSRLRDGRSVLICAASFAVACKSFSDVVLDFNHSTEASETSFLQYFFRKSVTQVLYQALLVLFGIYTFWRLQLQYRHFAYKLGSTAASLCLLTALLTCASPVAIDARIAAALLLCMTLTLMFLAFCIVQQQMQMKTAEEQDNFGPFSSGMLVLFALRTGICLFYAVLHLGFMVNQSFRWPLMEDEVLFVFIDVVADALPLVYLAVGFSPRVEYGDIERLQRSAALQPRFWGSTVWKTVKRSIDVRFWFAVVQIALMNALFWLWGVHSTCSLTNLGSLLGWSALVARGAAFCLRALLPILIISIHPSIVTYLHKTVIRNLLPLENKLRMHFILTAAVYIMSIIHIGGQVGVFITVVPQSRWDLLSLSSPALYTIPALTGIVLTICLILFFVTGYMRYFFAHRYIVVSFSLAYLCHGSIRMFSFPFGAVIFSLALAVFIIASTIAKSHSVKIRSAAFEDAEADGFKKLRLYFPDSFPLHRRRAIIPGMYFQVACREVAMWHWRSYTIAAVTDECVTLIMQDGQFSRTLVECISLHQSRLDSDLRIILNGPFSTPATRALQLLQREDQTLATMVVFTGGIGATVALGILDYIRSNPPKSPTFIRIVCTAKSWKLLDDVAEAAIQAAIASDAVRIDLHLHETSSSQRRSNRALEVPEIFQGRLGIATYDGRYADATEYLMTIPAPSANRVPVFLCGKFKSVIRDAIKRAHKQSNITYKLYVEEF